MHLNKFLDTLKDSLPAICVDKDLIQHMPNFFKSAVSITRLRAQGQCPPYFYIAPHVLYLRDDILCWVKERYRGENPREPTSIRSVNKRAGSRKIKGGKS